MWTLLTRRLGRAGTVAFAATALTVALASLAYACSVVMTSPHYLVVVPTEGSTGDAVVVTGTCVDEAALGCGTDQIFNPVRVDDDTPGRNPDLEVNDIFFYRCTSGDNCAMPPVVDHPDDPSPMEHDQTLCPDSDSTTLDNVQLTIIYTTKATFVEGTGDIPSTYGDNTSVQSGKHLICADPEPSLLWNLFTVT